MKTIACYILLLFVLLSQAALAEPSPSPVAAVAMPVDSSQQQVAQMASSSTEDNDFNPGLGLFALFAITAILFCIGAGIALGLVAAAAVAGMLAAGLLSGSMLIGWYQKSVLAGFKFLLYGGLSVGGGMTGSLFIWFVNRGLHWFSPGNSLIIGAVGGIMTGILMAFLLIQLLQRVVKHLGVLTQKRDD